MQWHPGNGVGMGKDFTLFAKQPGIVVYQASKYIRKVRPFEHASIGEMILQLHLSQGLPRVLPYTDIAACKRV